MKLRNAVFVLCLFAAAPVFGSENCGMMNGICRDACTPDEQILEGAFIDCGEKQECCVVKPQTKDRYDKPSEDKRWKKPAQ